MTVKLCGHVQQLLKMIAETGVILVGIESFICPKCPEIVLASRDSNQISLTKLNLGDKPVPDESTK